MKISKSKIKSLVMEAMKNTLSENSPDDLKKAQVKKADAVRNALSTQLANIDMEATVLDRNVEDLIAAIKMYTDPKSYAQGGIFSDTKSAEESLDLLVKPHIEKIKDADPFYAYTVYAGATKGLSDSNKKEVEKLLGERGLPRPDKAALAKSPIYQKNQAIVSKSPLFKAMESEAGKQYMQKPKTMPAGSEKANESKMMNENKIRAIIRHELIQSMKK